MGFIIKEFYDAENYYSFKKLATSLFRYSIEGLDNKEKFMSEYKEEENRNYFRLGAFYEDRLCAAMLFPCYTVNFDGHQLKMYGVGDVIADFNQPEKGAIKAINKKAFEMMLENNAPLTHLYPFEQNYYRQYGYEISCDSSTWEIPVSAFKLYDGAKFVQFDNSDKMKNEIKDIYEAFAKSKNMSVIRNDEAWKHFFNDYKAYSSGKFSYVSYVNGVADAFMAYRVKHYDNKPVDFTVERLYFKSYEGLRGILSYFSTQKPYADKAYIKLPGDIDISPIIDSCTGFGMRHSSAKFENDGLSKVVDVEAILKLAAYKGTGSVTIKISNDTYCPWNNDCFTVKFGETTTVERGGTDPDIEMSINSFSAGILGRTPFETLEMFTDVKVNGNTEDLKKVFYKKSCWIEEHF